MSRISDKKIYEENFHSNTTYQNLETFPKKSLECVKKVFDNQHIESAENIFKATTRTIGLIKAHGSIDEQSETEFSRCCCCTCCTQWNCSASSMENDNV